ncbi:hypothetical protein [Proteus terrae]|uniref:hypothetical protein n=1 Tax=Proteus terrae TaxID=1574161 RepID=UPI001BAE39FC|nr:hypothetical protein [Proteus terrae]QUT03836.1 hypothetical protein KF949_11890 [Proteus terrae subsp. cibarius]
MWNIQGRGFSLLSRYSPYRALCLPEKSQLNTSLAILMGNTGNMGYTVEYKEIILLPN